MLATTSGARFIGGLVFLEILETLGHLVPREPEASKDAAEQKGSVTL